MSLVKVPGTASETALAAAEVGAVANFFSDGFFQHYNLYTFVFTQEQAVRDDQVTLPVEIPHTQPFDGNTHTGVTLSMLCTLVL